MVIRYLFRATGLLACAIALASCGSSNCLYCERDACDETQAASWNVELAARYPDPCTQTMQQSFASPIPPLMLVRGGRDTVYRVEVPCRENGRCIGFRSVELPGGSVTRITTTSDPLIPPSRVQPAEACVNCTRERDGLLIFDKVELRAMGGYRGPQTAVFYPDAAGGVLHEPDVFGFTRGGTNITMGGEVSFLWDVARVGERSMFHLGVLTGVWPVDGSTFIPVSIHPRLTVNNDPDPYGCNCDAWYLFGDAGWVTIGGDGAPYTPLFDRRFFFGVGAGYEWALGRDVDLGVDVYYRRTQTPLPAIDCCPDIPADLRHPMRRAHVVGLRLGITF
jgi:hypothetical protein